MALCLFKNDGSRPSAPSRPARPSRASRAPRLRAAARTAPECAAPRGASAAFRFAGPSLSTTRRDDLGAEARDLHGLVHDQQPPGLLHRCDHRVLVPRPDGAQVEQIDLDALGGEQFARPWWRPASAADHVTTVAASPSLTLRATPNGIGSIGSAISPCTPNRSFGSKNSTGSSERIACTRRPAVSAGVDGRHHDHARQMREPGLQHLRVLRGRVAPHAVRHAHHHGGLRLPAEHVADLGDLVDQLVHRAHHEIEDAHLDDRPHADQRRAEPRAHDGRFRDRRGDDALARRTRRGNPCTGPTARRARRPRRAPRRAGRGASPARRRGATASISVTVDHATAPVSCTSSNATRRLGPRRRVRAPRARAAISAFASSIDLAELASADAALGQHARRAARSDRARAPPRPPPAGRHAAASVEVWPVMR